MESRHLAKNINVSLKKLRSFLPEVKKMSPVDAHVTLGFLPHSAARALVAAIQTAIANAENTLKVPKSMLEFRQLKADQGMVLKRFRAGSRGTALPVVRRMSHITIVLGVKNADSKEVISMPEKAKAKQSSVKKSEKKEVSTKTKKPSVKAKSEVVEKSTVPNVQ